MSRNRQKNSSSSHGGCVRSGNSWRRRRQTNSSDMGNITDHDETKIFANTPERENLQESPQDDADFALRPTPPLAPNNSTSFIMDNHETSSLFVNFHEDSSAHVRDSNENSPCHPADWFPFNVADFQTTYRSAREDKMMGLSGIEVISKILLLESKVVALRECLAASPSRILAQLQSQLLVLQEENKRLLHRRELLRSLNRVSSSSDSSDSSTCSSTSSDTDSDSSFSGPDEEQSVRLANGGQEEEEEKENTQPEAT